MILRQTERVDARCPLCPRRKLSALSVVNPLYALGVLGVLGGKIPQPSLLDEARRRLGRHVQVRHEPVQLAFNRNQPLLVRQDQFPVLRDHRF